MVTDLQIKVEKYETKAAKCEESARRAPDEPERAFYQELANYYGAVATDFRQVIENGRPRRGAAQLYRSAAERSYSAQAALCVSGNWTRPTA